MTQTAATAPLVTIDRVHAARAVAAETGADLLVLTPGSDLRYLTGYNAHAMERLTALAVPREGEPFLVVPRLEAPMVELPSGTLTADQANVRGAALANLTGIPSISAPAGISEDGLPIALQLQAAWGGDELLLDAAEALEQANERRWVEALPPLAMRPSAA